MGKNILTLLLIINIAVAYPQSHTKENHVFDAIYGPTVIINKTVASYTYSNSKVDNGKSYNSKLHSDLKKPFYIIIKSDNSSASIQINSNKLREDIFMKFQCIHKIIASDNITYEFYGYNNESVSYIIPTDGSHQSLYISLRDEKNNGSSYFFIISKYEQL